MELEVRVDKEGMIIIKRKQQHFVFVVKWGGLTVATPRCRRLVGTLERAGLEAATHPSGARYDGRLISRSITHVISQHPSANL